MLYAFVTSSYCTCLNLLSLLHVRSYQHTSCFSLPSLYSLVYSSQDVVLPVPQTQFAMSHFWDFKSHRKCRSLLSSYSLSLSPFLQFKDCKQFVWCIQWWLWWGLLLTASQLQVEIKHFSVLCCL